MELLRKHRKTDEAGAMEGGCSLMHSQGTESPSLIEPLHAGSCREYYMGEGGGFPRIRAMVNLVSPKLPMACPSTKGAPESELTNLLVGLM
jgi:hypothetical protein